jgi:monothiol glutaredoxin
MAADPAQTIIAKTIADNDIVLFMKGTKQFPQCGFSATAAKILEHLGVQFKDVNVLEDAGVRDGIKTFSNWPTIPQLYVKGEFVGGCDIMKEMYTAHTPITTASAAARFGLCRRGAEVPRPYFAHCGCCFGIWELTQTGRRQCTWAAGGFF